MECGTEDLSDHIAWIEVALQALAQRQVQERLSAYLAKVEEREGKRFGKWQNMPDAALESLAEKLKRELSG